MYLYYELYPGPLGLNDPTSVIECVLSSDSRTTAIHWKNKAEDMVMKMISSIFKQVRVDARNYDELTHVWTFIGPSGNILITQLKSLKTQGLFPNLELKEIADLQARLKRGRLDIDFSKIKQSSGGNEQVKFKEEDFFYSEPKSSSEISGAALNEALAKLLSIEVAKLSSSTETELKKLYRAAALRYHPDRNGGDAKNMTELNYLWNIFNSQVRA